MTPSCGKCNGKCESELKEFEVRRLAMIRQRVIVMATCKDGAIEEAQQLKDWEWESDPKTIAPVDGKIDSREVEFNEEAEKAEREDLDYFG